MGIFWSFDSFFLSSPLFLTLFRFFACTQKNQSKKIFFALILLIVSKKMLILCAISLTKVVRKRKR